MPEGVSQRLHLHRQPHAHGTALDAPGTVHWSTPIAPTGRKALVESTEDAVAHIAGCLPREQALAVWESAARKERLSQAALREVRWKTVAARECAESVTGLSDSGLETIFAFRLRHLRVGIRLQVVIAGRRVDALIGDRLVTQIDGYAFHSSAADRRRDVEHDAELVLRGYTVVRFTYARSCTTGRAPSARSHEPSRAVHISRAEPAETPPHTCAAEPGRGEYAEMRRIPGESSASRDDLRA